MASYLGTLEIWDPYIAAKFTYEVVIVADSKIPLSLVNVRTNLVFLLGFNNIFHGWSRGKLIWMEAKLS